MQLMVMLENGARFTLTMEGTCIYLLMAGLLRLFV